MDIENSKGNRLCYISNVLISIYWKFEKGRIEFYNKCLNPKININKKIRYLAYFLDYGEKINKYSYVCKVIDL